MTESRLAKDMSGPGTFGAAHAEAEIERLQRAGTSVVWKAPTGEHFSMLIPPTVYPPREDTDLLASVLTPQRLPPKTQWLEIGCGSGALSLHAARLGCKVTACDINPLAVACTRAHFDQNGLQATILEGGPGPLADGTRSQWGGDQTYDVVVWNTPYLGADALVDGMLGPMEEAALTDTDRVGLFVRMARLIATTPLLSKSGVAYLTVSSKGDGKHACELAWAEGVAARCIATTTFEDGEQLSVIAMWKPYADAPVLHRPVTSSTNDDVVALAGAVGSSVRADVQTTGRGRRGRLWKSYSGAFMGSWLVHSGQGWPHTTGDQLRAGEALVRLVRHMSERGRDDVCLKWPNDLYARASDGALKKAAGVLFEAFSQGDVHHVILGLGLNIETGGQAYASLHDLGFQTSAEDLHVALHAMVASLFQQVDHLPQAANVRVEQEVLHGVSLLGPVFYRNNKVLIETVHPSGSLSLRGWGEPVDEPDELTWSGV